MASTVQSIASLLFGIAGGIAIGCCWKRWDEDFELDGRLVVAALVLIVLAVVINPGAPT